MTERAMLVREWLDGKISSGELEFYLKYYDKLEIKNR
jgi:hypothetical protein